MKRKIKKGDIVSWSKNTELFYDSYLRVEKIDKENVIITLRGLDIEKWEKWEKAMGVLAYYTGQRREKVVKKIWTKKLPKDFWNKAYASFSVNINELTYLTDLGGKKRGEK